MSKKYDLRFRYGSIKWDGANTAEVIQFMNKSPNFQVLYGSGHGASEVVGPDGIKKLTIEPNDIMRHSPITLRVGDTLELVQDGYGKCLEVKEANHAK